MRDAVPEAEAQQVTAARAIVEAEAADFERTLAGRAMDPLITALRAQVGRVVAEEIAPGIRDVVDGPVDRVDVAHSRLARDSCDAR